ncbi:MAG: SpoIIE family protein phosphatase [Eubacterium sp.]|nr:SpoIIE family protein phosphatase [Eubacterium sp.]
MAVIQRALVEKSGEKLKTNKGLAFLLYFALGFLLSFGRVVGDVTPFCISITAASPKRYFPFAAAGAALGCAFGGINAVSAKYFAGITLALLGALAANAFDLYYKPSFVMAVAFVSDFVSGAVLCLRLGSTAGEYVLLLGEAVLCGGGAFFFYRSINSSYKRLRFRALPISDVSCIVISLGIVTMNLSSICIGKICPARAAVMLLILLAVRYSGERRALILALALGFSLSIAQKGELFIVGALAFSTLVASLFSSLSVFATAGAFLCSVGFFAAAENGEVSLPLFLECAISAVLFVLIPQSLNDKLAFMLEADEAEAHDGSLRQNLVLKLRFASNAMAAISESVDTVRERINEITRQKNDYDRENLSEEEYIRREIVLEKTNQIRMVASDQFFSISDMLEDLAFEFDEAEIFDTAAASRIRRLLGDYDIYADSICVIEDKFGRIRVEILTDSDTAFFDRKSLVEEIGKTVGRYFDTPRITNFKNETMLSFTERANYKLSVGYAQHSAEGKLCGDTVKAVSDGRGHSLLIISDGMGKGSRAALDGAMGAGLISKLLTAGFGFDSALKVVNSALLVKSSDESLATLDIASVDLYTGKLEIYKAGAPASYIIKNKSVTKCELTSMPAGILRGVEFAKRTAVLGCEDSVVLMSDGICDLGSEWIEKTLLSLDGLGVQETADAVLTRALNERDGKKLDDMSIICAKLERN